MKQTHSERGVSLTLHSGTPLRYYRLINTLPDYSPDDDAGYIYDRFVICEGYVIDYHFDDTSHPLAEYYERRAGKTILERAELFERLLGIEEMNLLTRAFNSTRAVELPLELPPDVKDDDQKKDILSSGGEIEPNGEKPKNGKAKASTQNIMEKELP